MERVFFSDVQYIIFSKNRPLQLYSLLESIEKNIRAKNIQVIFYSSSEYLNNYEKVFNRFPYVISKKESSFREDTMDIINSVESDFISFLVDDDLIYKKPKLDYFEYDNNLLCFAPRIGIKHNYCQPADSSYISLEKIGIKGDIEYSWEWNGNLFDLGYPFSLDGNIFKSELIKLMIRQIKIFTNPNTLEDSLMYFNPLKSRLIKTNMKCFKESFIINLPINRVNTTHPNKAGVIVLDGNTKILNDRFNENLKIDWENMEFDNVRECHREIDLKFTQITE